MTLYSYCRARSDFRQKSLLLHTGLFYMTVKPYHDWQHPRRVFQVSPRHKTKNADNRQFLRPATKHHTQKDHKLIFSIVHTEDEKRAIKQTELSSIGNTEEEKMISSSSFIKSPSLSWSTPWQIETLWNRNVWRGHRWHCPVPRHMLRTSGWRLGRPSSWWKRIAWNGWAAVVPVGNEFPWRLQWRLCSCCCFEFDDWILKEQRCWFNWDASSCSKTWNETDRAATVGRDYLFLQTLETKCKQNDAIKSFIHQSKRFAVLLLMSRPLEKRTLAERYGRRQSLIASRIFFGNDFHSQEEFSQRRQILFHSQRLQEIGLMVLVKRPFALPQKDWGGTHFDSRSQFYCQLLQKLDS